jgi:NAD(P)-dependent dehydrogenase (short-subunit alcohol dehydrogenase family)
MDQRNILMKLASKLEAPISAIIVGASGGLGNAFVRALLEEPSTQTVMAIARREVEWDDSRVVGVPMDIEDEASIERAAKLCAPLGPFNLLINAVGLLHGPNGARPEKGLRDLSAARLAKLMAVNAIGPALVMKHFTGLMERDTPAIMASLSARVGSISDNQLGGWYGYRAAKAALHQFVRTSAVELAIKRPKLTCVALHPGTVRTDMSQPFLASYTANEIFAPDFAANSLLDVLADLTPANTGRVFAWDGQEIVP